ncbi:hypothetical protein HanPSC8_Chr06g0266111 [Helianthus annuus]|nr:hypothetical protein HanPSC8_Chr06g0266111 [Helianthus annuus]
MFTQSFFSLTGISYIQAMPMIWRVLYTFERIIEQEGIDLGMAELAELYDLLRWFHRYLLKRKAGEDHPIFKVTKNDTNWKRRFFFVKRDSIPDGKDLPKEWATHGRVEDPRRITISAGKSARSVKSASIFGISDLANVTSSKKKAPAASPSASAPKASIRGKGKKRKTSEDLQGFPLLRQQFLDT